MRRRGARRATPRRHRHVARHERLDNRTRARRRHRRHRLLGARPRRGSWPHLRTRHFPGVATRRTIRIRRVDHADAVHRAHCLAGLALGPASLRHRTSNTVGRHRLLNRGVRGCSNRIPATRKRHDRPHRRVRRGRDGRAHVARRILDWRACVGVPALEQLARAPNGCGTHRRGRRDSHCARAHRRHDRTR